MSEARSTHQATGSTADDDEIVVIAVVAHGLRHRASRFRRGERFSHSLRNGEADGRERRRRRVLRARLRDQRAGERAKRAPELSPQGARSALPSRERETVVRSERCLSQRRKRRVEWMRGQPWALLLGDET